MTQAVHATGPFRDAEAWLAARGVARQALEETPALSTQPPKRQDQSEAASGSAAGANSQTAESRRLEDDVKRAVAYARRSTARAPKSSARLEAALAARFPGVDVEAAVTRCRAEGIVDDLAFANALVDAGQRKGHAPRRIRADLEARGLPSDVIEEVLEAAEVTDPEAAAYALAAQRADRLRNLAPETAYRRIVRYLEVRGYPQAVACTVARQAMFNDRGPPSLRRG